MAWLSEAKDPIFGFPTVARFGNIGIQKILFSECARINWFDIHRVAKGEYAHELFEPPSEYTIDIGFK